MKYLITEIKVNFSLIPCPVPLKKFSNLLIFSNSICGHFSLNCEKKSQWFFFNF